MESLLILHAVAAACAPWLVTRLGRASYFAVLAVPPAAGLAYTGWLALRGLPARESRPWVQVLGLELSFRADPLAVLMMALVTGVGVLVLGYSARYFSAADEGLGRYGGVMVAFAGSMLGLVATDDLLLLYVFWELTTVFSYLLIGHDPASRPSRQAAMKALSVTTFGGLAMLAGFVLVGQAAGTYQISEIVARPPDVAPVALVLVLVGGAVEVGDLPVQHVAAGRDGGADSGLGVPARRGDGEGGGVPAGPAGPGVRRRGVVAVGGGAAGRGDDAAGRLAGAAGDGPEAAAGVRDGQPARPDGAAVRRGHGGHGGGGRRDGAGARAVQGRPVPRGGHRGPRDGHAGPARAERARPGDAVDVRGGGAGGRVDGGAAAAGGIRGQGGGAGVAAGHAARAGGGWWRARR
ncbi:hypothetical protein GCM10020001_088400 [Nonomuraea salmonea]